MTYAEEAPEASWQIKTCIDVHPVLTSQQSQLKQIDLQITNQNYQPHLNNYTTVTTHTDKTNMSSTWNSNVLMQLWGKNSISLPNSSKSSSGITPKVKNFTPCLIKHVTELACSNTKWLSGCLLTTGRLWYIGTYKVLRLYNDAFDERHNADEPRWAREL